MFEPCGNIKRVRIIMNDEGRSKGFGFVDFYDVDSAKNGLKKSGEKHSGREIHVDFSIPRS
jgi:nucleolin